MPEVTRLVLRSNDVMTLAADFPRFFPSLCNSYSRISSHEANRDSESKSENENEIERKEDPIVVNSNH